MRICVYGSASDDIDGDYIEQSEKLCELLARSGHSLVFGAGAHGLMGAAARGFYKYHSEIIGVAPRFFNVDGVLFGDCTELIRTDTMRSRKQKMDDLSDAVITLPGGIGTFEEFFEILTLKQLGQSVKPLVLYNLHGYFDKLHELLENCVNGGFMPDKTLELCAFADSEGEVLDRLEKGLRQAASGDFKVTDYRNVTISDSSKGTEEKSEP